MPDRPPMRDPNAVVYLVPGVGMITFAKDKATARIAGEFYVNAINVMRGASTRLDLCRACPSRRPSTSNTGCSRRPSCSACRSRRRSPAGSRWSPAAPAASAGPPPTRLLREGACVVLADIDEAALDSADAELGKRLRQGLRAQRAASTSPARSRCHRRLRRGGGRIRRHRHPGLQCRHRLVGADRGDRAVDVEPATWTSWRPAISWCRARPSG